MFWFLRKSRVLRESDGWKIDSWYYFDLLLFECLGLDVLQYYKRASFWMQQKFRTELHL